MGNFSMWEILLILVVVLLLFGAKRIPEIAGSFGKGIREFKKSMTDVERSIAEPDRPAHRLPPEQPRETVRHDEEQQPEPRRLI